MDLIFKEDLVEKSIYAAMKYLQAKGHRITTRYRKSILDKYKYKLAKYEHQLNDEKDIKGAYKELSRKFHGSGLNKLKKTSILKELPKAQKDYNIQDRHKTISKAKETTIKPKPIKRKLNLFGFI